MNPSRVGVLVIITAVAFGAIACAQGPRPEPVAGPTPVTGTGTGGTGNGGGSSPVSGGAGLRTSLCRQLPLFADAQWVTLPTLSGLDAKLYYNRTFATAEVAFRNRYQDTIHHNFELFTGGTPPRTRSRHSIRAGGESSAGGILQSVSLGGQACVVVDSVRFGSSDSGPYYGG